MLCVIIQFQIKLHTYLQYVYTQGNDLLQQFVEIPRKSDGLEDINDSKTMNYFSITNIVDKASIYMFSKQYNGMRAVNNIISIDVNITMIGILTRDLCGVLYDENQYSE